jgi:prephenate dehydrogenase
VVTDVGSVKGPICAAVVDGRFCGGHPMAGSELDGLEGADGSLFEGAVWVLTPTPGTTDATFATVARVVSDLGAEVVAVPPERHDALVAVVSHVPHLTAAALMTVADQRAEEHAALLRLAAGGFRDMTRIAAGHPAMWLDICAENRTAIVDALDALLDRLRGLRRGVAEDDRELLLGELSRARVARVNLPGRAAATMEMAELRTAIPDRPGAAAEVFTLAAELGVNVIDFEVFHSAEGGRGVLILVVEAAQSDLFRGGLMARGFRPSARRLA